jgi:hypothetical protein
VGEPLVALRARQSLGLVDVVSVGVNVVGQGGGSSERLVTQGTLVWPVSCMGLQYSAICLLSVCLSVCLSVDIYVSLHLSF